MRSLVVDVVHVVQGERDVSTPLGPFDRGA